MFLRAGDNTSVKMIAAEPNLIRRPIIITGKKMILGFDQESIDEL